jgi:hypothetical protein
MTRLPAHRIQCDRCLTVVVLQAKDSAQWGEELHSMGWVARPYRGGMDYRHACRMCSDEFLADIEGRKARRF